MNLSLWYYTYLLRHQNLKIYSIVKEYIKGEHHCDGRKNEPIFKIFLRNNLQFYYKIVITYL